MEWLLTIFFITFIIITLKIKQPHMPLYMNDTKTNEYIKSIDKFMLIMHYNDDFFLTDNPDAREKLISSPRERFLKGLSKFMFVFYLVVFIGICFNLVTFKPYVLNISEYFGELAKIIGIFSIVPVMAWLWKRSLCDGIIEGYFKGYVDALDKARHKKPIHIAAQFNEMPALAFHIQNGADINKRDEFGETPLSWAIKHHSVEAIKLLVEHGAKDIDINERNSENKQTAMHVAVLNDDVQLAKLLLNRGAKDSLYKADRSLGIPFFFAIHKQNPNMVKLILNSGFNPEIYDMHGQTALYYAAGYGDLVASHVPDPSIEVMNLLIAAGANVNAKNVRGETPLHNAVQKFSIRANLLLSNGADVNARTTNGETPFTIAKRHFAEQFGKSGEGKKMYDLLLKYGVTE